MRCDDWLVGYNYFDELGECSALSRQCTPLSKTLIVYPGIFSPCVDDVTSSTFVLESRFLYFIVGEWLCVRFIILDTTTQAYSEIAITPSIIKRFFSTRGNYIMFWNGLVCQTFINIFSRYDHNGFVSSKKVF